MLAIKIPYYKHAFFEETLQTALKSYNHIYIKHDLD